MKTLCEKCGCPVNGHAIDCIDIPKEQLRETIDNMQILLNSMTQKKIRMKDQVMFWQGKYSIVKQENNKLRKILYKTVSGTHNT